MDLFRARNGRWVTDQQIRASLEALRVPEAKVIYMHTELSFGVPNPRLSRKELLTALYEILKGIRVPTLCVPTFTFSFCNGDDYDVQRSVSKMGALNEYIRQLPNALRSLDPLMSVALVGEDRDLATDLGHHSIGSGSTFDKLHSRRGVKFLFFGASLSKCFTYTHYVEEREEVYYRYNRDFSGTITDHGRQYQDTYSLFVRYRNVIPSAEGRLERELVRTDALKLVPCGDSAISSVEEPVAYAAIAGQLRANINCYLAEPYPGNHLDRGFEAHNMVAL